MTESEYIEKLQSLWPSGEGEWASMKLLQLSEEAIHAFPRSAELWNLRGDAIQLADQSCPSALDEALMCYKRALDIDPCSIDALEGIGFFYDVHRDDLESAENSFRAAITLGGSPQCYAGLARVLQERGHSRDALELLSAESCPFYFDRHVAETRAEIEREVWVPVDDK